MEPRLAPGDVRKHQALVDLVAIAQDLLHESCQEIVGEEMGLQPQVRVPQAYTEPADPATVLVRLNHLAAVGWVEEPSRPG